MSTAQTKIESTATQVQPPVEPINPATQGYMNQLVAAAVREALASMMPMVEKMALTPEKLAEAERLRRAPDPERVAQQRRQDRIAKLDIEENAKATQAAQRSCLHHHPNGKLACGIIRNTFDKRPRFVCMLCQSWFYPAEWSVAAPDDENLRGKPYVREAHPQYREILNAFRLEHPEEFQ